MSEMTCKIVFLVGFTTVFAVRFYFARLLQSSKIKDDLKTVSHPTRDYAARFNAARNVYLAFDWHLYPLVRVC